LKFFYDEDIVGIHIITKDLDKRIVIKESNGANSDFGYILDILYPLAEINNI
jgi:hypothetical protein